MAKCRPKTPQPLAAWVVVCVYFACAGWGLSAIHELNLAGYSAVVLAGLVAAAIWWKRSDRDGWEWLRWRKLAKRFRRPFALAFLALAVMAFAGGVLHAPNNYDGLTYRMPRLLNWLAEGHWYWIPTDFERLNTRTSVFEWLSAPFLVFTGTDRLIFLLNTVSFLMLPGLVFSVMIRMGVRARTAWHWMWIIAAGYGYLLQAGSIVNDMFGAVFALAAVDFALRAAKSGRLSQACVSLLAAALMTGTKASNLPLLLPWAIAFAAAWRVWLRRPLILGMLAVPAVVVSFVPTALLNQMYGHDWTGARIESEVLGGGNAWVHLVNNGVNNFIQNVAPPVFPLASAWNREMPRLIPAGFASELEKCFEKSAAHWELGEMQLEEVAGLGFGATTLLLASVAAAACCRRKAVRERGPPGNVFLWLLQASPWVSLLYMMEKMGLSGGARYLIPYYPLLMAGLLSGEAQARLVKRGWWRAWAWVGFGLAAMLLAISPARPLWPEHWFFNHFGSRLEASHTGSRMMTVYEVYGARNEAFAPVVRELPTDAQVLGLVTFDDPETSLWRPFGARRILHVRAADSGEDIRRRGIKYVLVKVSLLQEPWEEWLRRVNARPLQTFQLKLRAGEDASEWRLVEMKPGAGVTEEIKRADLN